MLGRIIVGGTVMDGASALHFCIKAYGRAHLRRTCLNVPLELAPDQSQTPARKSESFSWLDSGAIILISTVWTLLAFVIDARGDFALMDDWSYGLPVRALLERGEIRFTDWSTAILGIQVFWGAIFSLPAGLSFTALRISSLAAGLIGLIGLYGLLRQLGASRAVSLFATFTVVCNPVYICVSYSFMTDIPFMCLLILSCFFLTRGMLRDSNGAIWVGLLLAFASVFVRQIGMAIFLGFAAAYPFWRGFGKRWLLQAILPAVLAVIALKACERGLLAIERLPRAYNNYTASTAEFFSLLFRARIGVFKIVLSKLWQLVMFLGLYSLPFSLLCWPSRLAQLSRRARIVELFCVAGLSLVVAAALVATGAIVLPRYNMIYDFGAGPRLGDSQMASGWPGRMPAAADLALKAITAFGAILALHAFSQAVWRTIIRPNPSAQATWRLCAFFLVAVCAFYTGATSFSFLISYDRYLLGLLPAALVFIWMGMSADPPATLRLRPVGVVASLFFLTFYLAFATLATHDYLDWSRVRWNTNLAVAQEFAVPLTDIDGGWEFNNYVVSLDRLYKSYQERELVMEPPEKLGRLWGHAGLDRPFRVSAHVATGYELVRKVPLSPWLPLAPTEFIVSKRIGREPAGK
jgi:hypothetical protein